VGFIAVVELEGNWLVRDERAYGLMVLYGA